MKFSGENNTGDKRPGTPHKLLNLLRKMGAAGMMHLRGISGDGYLIDASITDRIYSDLCNFDNFPTPADQLLTELSEIENYKQKYSNDKERWTLLQMLESIIDVTTGIVMNPNIATDSNRRKFNENIGLNYLDTPLDTIVPLIKRSSKIQLLSPIIQFRRTDDVSDEEANYNHALANAVQAGHVLGPVPAHVNDAFEAVFRIIGAAKVRDDRERGLRRGSIFWRGEYQGQVLYIEIYYYDSCDPNEYPYFGAEVLSNELGGKSANAEK